MRESSQHYPSRAPEIPSGINLPRQATKQEVADSTSTSANSWRRGDYIPQPKIETPSLNSPGLRLTLEPLTGPYGVVLVSLTCDLKKPITEGKSSYVHVSPVVKLSEAEIKLVATKDLTGYATLPSLPQGCAIDLHLMTPIDHRSLENVERHPTRATLLEEKQLGAAINFLNRKTFPDEVASIVNRLRKNTKNLKEKFTERNLSDIFKEVEQIRIAAVPDLQSTIEVLTFIILIKPHDPLGAGVLLDSKTNLGKMNRSELAGLIRDHVSGIRMYQDTEIDAIWGALILNLLGQATQKDSIEIDVQVYKSSEYTTDKLELSEDINANFL